VATIAKVHADQALDFTPAFEQRLRERAADPAHRADRHGKFIYSNAQYGLDAAELKRQFAAYSERFGV
jgi:hypothetical protein